MYPRVVRFRYRPGDPVRACTALFLKFYGSPGTGDTWDSSPEILESYRRMGSVHNTKIKIKMACFLSIKKLNISIEYFYFYLSMNEGMIIDEHQQPEIDLTSVKSSGGLQSAMPVVAGK